jgi:single-strand DNA-binding protein
MNRVVLFGRLGRDPQPRAKNPVAHFSLAVSEPYTDRATGERVGRVTWFHITAWGHLSEIASQYLKKGDQVLVEGRIQLREFTGRDGGYRSMLQVTATRIEFGAKRRTEVADDTTPRDEVHVHHEGSGDFSETGANDGDESGGFPVLDSAESFMLDDDIPW